MHQQGLLVPGEIYPGQGGEESPEKEDNKRGKEENVQDFIRNNPLHQGKLAEPAEKLIKDFLALQNEIKNKEAQKEILKKLFPV